MRKSAKRVLDGQRTPWIPGPWQLIKYSAVATECADVVGKALWIKSVEMRSCTVATNDLGHFFRGRYPRRFGAVLKQENVHIGIRLGVLEVCI